jgi:hypothetical protein
MEAGKKSNNSSCNMAGRSVANGDMAGRAEDRAPRRAHVRRALGGFATCECCRNCPHQDAVRSDPENKEASLVKLRIMASEAAMSQDNTPVPSTEGAAQGQTMSEAELDQMHSILDFVYDYRTPEYAHLNLYHYATPD